MYLNPSTHWVIQAKTVDVLPRTALAAKILATKTTDCRWITQIMMMLAVVSVVVVVVVEEEDDDDDDN